MISVVLLVLQEILPKFYNQKMTKISINAKLKVLQVTFLFLLLCLFSSCYIEEGECGCCETTFLQVKVIDSSTNQDITSSGDVDILDLFIFQPDGRYFDHISIHKDSIINQLPIQLSVPDIENYWISAWGNLKGNETVSKIVTGCLMDSLSIYLKASPEGYALCPDDLFFGFKQLHRHTIKNGVNVEEILVLRNNARMSITVRGLPQESDPADYYFTIQNGSNGYDFRGKPLTTIMEMKQNGIFQPNTHDFVTQGAFDIIHSKKNQCLTVNLHDNKLSYTKAMNTPANTGTIIASVTKDSNGELLSPEAGKTTNVLIDLTQGVLPVVTLIVTPWNELYNWAVW